MAHPRSLSLLVAAVVAAVVLVLAPAPSHAAVIDPNDKGEPLFSQNDPNITFLTDANWDAVMALKSDKPWLVDFYHPFCPHCKHFVPVYHEVAAYYKEEGSINIGAISCMDHVKCRRVAIKGFPTLMAINFDKKNPGKEVRRVVGTHTLQEVKDYVNDIFLEAKVNETGTQPPSTAPTVTLTTDGDVDAPKPGEQTRKEIWEESTLPMNQTTRLQDAGSAFVFGLKQGVFMGREVLEDDELDALKAWLELVSQTFPGVINRKLIKTLSDTLAPRALLDFDTWDEMVTTWQQQSVLKFLTEEAALDFSAVTVPVPEWQRLSDIFTGQGVAYRACALYTCGQWNMFHMLTMNPPPGSPGGDRSDQLMVSVIATMRRFMKHFFGCVQCRDHFLEYNNLEMVQKISEAENKPRALKRWLWEMHNAVNTRIRHPQWPKPDICPTCGSEGAWLDVEVDKWLANTYEYRDVEVPLAVGKAPEALRREPVEDNTDSMTAAEDLPEMPENPDPTVSRMPQELEAEVEVEIAEEAMDATPVTSAEDPHSPQVAPNEEDRKAEEEEAEGEAVTTQNKLTEPATLESTYTPKDAELGIDNAAHKANQKIATENPEEKEAVAVAVEGGEDALQGTSAPPMSLFAWYILPVAAVGAYLLFVKSRRNNQRGFRPMVRQ